MTVAQHLLQMYQTCFRVTAPAEKCQLNAIRHAEELANMHITLQIYYTQCNSMEHFILTKSLSRIWEERLAIAQESIQRGQHGRVQAIRKPTSSNILKYRPFTWNSRPLESTTFMEFQDFTECVNCMREAMYLGK